MNNPKSSSNIRSVRSNKTAKQIHHTCNVFIPHDAVLVVEKNGCDLIWSGIGKVRVQFVLVETRVLRIKAFTRNILLTHGVFSTS